MIIKLINPIKLPNNTSKTNKEDIIKEIKVELKKGVDSFSYILEGVKIIKKSVGEQLELFNKGADFTAKMQEVTLNKEEKEKMNEYIVVSQPQNSSDKPVLDSNGKLIYKEENNTDQIDNETSYEVFKMHSSNSYIELSNFIKDSLLSQTFLDVSLIGSNRDFDEEFLNEISHVDRVNIIKQFFLGFFSNIMKM